MIIDISKFLQPGNEAISFGKNQAAKVVAEAVQAVKIAAPSETTIKLTAENIPKLAKSIVETINLEDIIMYLKDIDLSGVIINLLGRIL